MPENPSPKKTGAPTRKTLITTLKITVSLVLVSFLLWKSGVAEIGSTLASANLWWLSLGLLLGLGAAMLQANQWRGLLEAFALHKGFWRCFRLDFAGRLFDAALPTNIGGDVVRVGLASDSRAEAAPAALAVVLRRIVSIPGLLLVITVSMLASWHLDYSGRVRAISLICLAGGLVLAVMLTASHWFGVLQRIPLPGKIDKLRRSLLEARVQATDGTHPFRRATLRGLLFWIAVVLSQTCYIRAVGISAPIEYSAAVIAAVNAISMIPISVGGYGLREGAFSALLGVAGVGSAAQGTAVGLTLSAQTLLFGLIGAIVYLGLHRSKPLAGEPLSAGTETSSPRNIQRPRVIAESSAHILDPS